MTKYANARKAIWVNTARRRYAIHNAWMEEIARHQLCARVPQDIKAHIAKEVNILNITIITIEPFIYKQSPTTTSYFKSFSIWLLPFCSLIL